MERHSRYVMLVKLPDGYGAERVRTAMAKDLHPARKAAQDITWDQGQEMAEHVQFTIDTGMQIYFCDPHSPWQRGSNENTNGLIRQYLPKSTDLSHPPDAPRRDRPHPQQPTSTDPHLDETIREVRRAVAMTA